MSDLSIGCICGCGRIAKSRGLCVNCYGKIAGQVRRGKTTWEQEVAAGRALEGITKSALAKRRWNR